MLNIRIPSPYELQDTSEFNKHLLGITETNILKYESGFLHSLIDYIKSDDILRHFYIRLICECENVEKVIKIANEIDLLDLEETIHNLLKAKSIEALSYYDSEFHKRLFAITGDVDFFKWWRLQSEGLHKFLDKFWLWIGYGTAQYDELLEVHRKIFDSIKNKNIDSANIAMQKHFAILLFQLLGSIYKN